MTGEKRKADSIAADNDEEAQEVTDLDARRYFKEGQRFVTPINGDSTRGFYESLLEEKPNSHLAIRYCVENGLFNNEKHSVLLKKYYQLKSSGIFNANRAALQRIAMKTGGMIKESPNKQLKRIKSEPNESPEKKKKKDKKEKKKKKKDKKDKKKKISSVDSD
jgi:hypothetical protein